MSHGLGRKPSPPDARDYKMADYFDKAKKAQKINTCWWKSLCEKICPCCKKPHIVSDKIWEMYKTLNQGSTPHCVGFGWAGWGICLPVSDHYSDMDGHNIYYECKVIDGEPQEENGSYVRSGAKAMKNRGRVGTYFFASSVEEAAEYISEVGPVVLGIDWYSGMWETDFNGIIKPTGNVVGGHCILWNGVQGKYAVLKNSWGSSWGINGMCKISFEDLKIAWGMYGEACAATELPL